MLKWLRVNAVDVWRVEHSRFPLNLIDYKIYFTSMLTDIRNMLYSTHACKVTQLFTEYFAVNQTTRFNLNISSGIF